MLGYWMSARLGFDGRYLICNSRLWFVLIISLVQPTPIVPQLDRYWTAKQNQFLSLKLACYPGLTRYCRPALCHVRLLVCFHSCYLRLLATPVKRIDTGIGISILYIIQHSWYRGLLSKQKTWSALAVVSFTFIPQYSWRLDSDSTDTSAFYHFWINALEINIINDFQKQLSIRGFHDNGKKVIDIYYIF